MSNIGEKALKALQRMEYFVNEDMGIKTFKQSGWHIEGSDDYELVKDALQKLNSIENTDNVDYNKALECLDKLFNEYVELCVDAGSNEHIYQECNLTSPYNIVKQTLLAAQNQKKYLKWEDLDFRFEDKYMKVKLNGSIYTLRYTRNTLMEFPIAYLEFGNTEITIIDCQKQFFNDLHLESVNE